MNTATKWKGNKKALTKQEKRNHKGQRDLRKSKNNIWTTKEA